MEKAMKLEKQRVLLTGATGGIGSALAETLHRKGAALALVGRSGDTLEPLLQRLKGNSVPVIGLCADLLDAAQRERAVAEAERQLGGIDIVINCAGMMSFRPFADEDPAVLERIVRVNLVAPMLLVRQVLPGMLARGSGRIVNVGSTFGSIGFAWFAAYSASKFGLRGLSEALRRELEGSGVGVIYVAPRAVRTKLNSDAVYRMAEVTGMRMDEPAWVASRILRAIERDATDVYLGFPEKLFARLNGLLPRVIDNGLRRQNRVMAPFAGRP
jgi:short-subunit dehydrogenase